MSDDDKPLSPSAQEIEAIKRIASTRDGALLHRFLRRVLEAVVDLESDSALRVQTGRRTLARDLMRHMADGLVDVDNAANAPILTRSGGAVSGYAPRGARRRVSGEPTEPDEG